MTKKITMVVLLAANLMGVQLQAGSLESYVAKLENHPQLQQILEQSIQFEELAEGEKGLPDLQIIIGVDNVPINNPAFDRFLPTSKTIGFRQQIPSFSLRDAKSEKQLQLSKRQKLMAAYTKQRLKALLISELVELDKIRTQEKLIKKQLGFYRSLEKDINSQLESGDPVYGRFSEIDVERAEIEQRLNDLKAERVDSEGELIHLVGEVPSLSLSTIKKRSWNKQGDTLYPVLIAREDVEVAEKDIDIADSAFDPNFSIQALYKQRESGAGFDGEDWFSIQGTVSVPLWYEQSQKPKLRAAEAGKRSQEFSYENTKRQWVKQMKSFQAERDIAYDNIQLFKKKKSAMRKMAQAAKREYEAGNGRLGMVLDAEIDTLNIATQLAGQESRYKRLVAEFNSHIAGGSHE